MTTQKPKKRDNLSLDPLRVPEAPKGAMETASTTRAAEGKRTATKRMPEKKQK